MPETTTQPKLITADECGHLVQAAILKFTPESYLAYLSTVISEAAAIGLTELAWPGHWESKYVGATLQTRPAPVGAIRERVFGLLRQAGFTVEIKPTCEGDEWPVISWPADPDTPF